MFLKAPRRAGGRCESRAMWIAIGQATQCHDFFLYTTRLKPRNSSTRLRFSSTDSQGVHENRSGRFGIADKYIYDVQVECL